MELQKYINSFSKVRVIGFLCLVAGTSTNDLELEKKSVKGRMFLIISKALVGQITIAVCVCNHGVNTHSNGCFVY